MESLNKAVESFVADYMTGRPARVRAGAVTAEFITARSEWPSMPPDLRQAAYLGIQQIVRPLLRSLDDVANATDNDTLDLELPEEAYLQDYYSTPGDDEERLYVRRDLMTFEEMERITARDRKLAAHFKRRADALEGWWYRTHDEQN